MILLVVSVMEDILSSDHDYHGNRQQIIQQNTWSDLLGPEKIEEDMTISVIRRSLKYLVFLKIIHYEKKV